MIPSHAIISGGSSGIGLALARRLAARGCHVTILARNEPRLSAARVEIERARLAPTQSVLALAADVADESQVTAAVKSSAERLGPPALVIASAGMVIPGLFEDLPLAAFRRMMEVNYLGTLHLVRAALPLLRSVKGGRVVLISSGAGLIGLYGYSAYAPSKFAVRALGEALRAELRLQGIAVHVVYPPDTDTPQLREEARTRPVALAKIAGGAKVRSADAVAAAILAGMHDGRFAIAPGWEMTALTRLHSVIAPLLNRFLFDPVVAKWHGREAARSS